MELTLLYSFILGICVGMGMAYVIMRMVIWVTLRQMERRGIEIENLVQKIKQDAQALVIEARLEEHQGEFFLFRKDTGEFIAQGATAQEITERTEKRILGRAVVVTESDDEVMERYRATKTVV
jgi:hypothetical protein